ncbi:MAG: hypothetical protein PHT78_12440 [Desulfitobacteriaceae bacterium]|nr:hypothetical protein [Desulfitobacteriaceae bacterium]MDD4754029.1 hypothetical protein [Desulfitobacteriaceae bacterium]
MAGVHASLGCPSMGTGILPLYPGKWEKRFEEALPGIDSDQAKAVLLK